MSNGITDLTTATFDETIGSSPNLVVVDFWAEWCGPCKKVAPILEEIAGERADEITIAKVNVDDNPDLATRHQVLSIPTMILFKDGEIVKTIVGAKDKTSLLEEFDEFLPSR